MEKPIIRLVHNLARSGGTVICKCLGVMGDVVLLSEINPRGMEQFNPIAQADRWYDLITPEDKETISAKDFIDFDWAIRLIEGRAREHGRHLVLRDWNHLDFVALPFMDEPTHRLLLVEVLRPHFDILNVAIVRHPLDQLDSLMRLTIWKDGRAPSPDDMLSAMKSYADACSQLPIIRYEDFVRDPDAALQGLCRHLDLPFDAAYKNKWQTFTKITGDVEGTRGGTKEIREVERRPPPREFITYLSTNKDYRQVCEVFGYAPS